MLSPLEGAPSPHIYFWIGAVIYIFIHTTTANGLCLFTLPAALEHTLPWMNIKVIRVSSRVTLCCCLLTFPLRTSLWSLELLPPGWPVVERLIGQLGILMDCPVACQWNWKLHNGINPQLLDVLLCSVWLFYRCYLPFSLMYLFRTLAWCLPNALSVLLTRCGINEKILGNALS